MALVARGVDSGTGINVLADAGATGDMQVVKLGISALGNEGLIPATVADGMLVEISNASIAVTGTISSVVTSVVPGTGATNLGKAEDAAATSGDVGVGALAVQRNTAVSDAADGDYVFLHTDSLGRLQISGTQIEDAAASSGDPGHFVLAIRRDTPTSGAAAGDYHELEVDSTGRLWVSGTFAEDAAAVSGDYGHFVLAVRRDTPTSGAAAGDYHELEVDALGRLWISGTQAEDAVATSGDTGHFMLAVRKDTRAADAADGDYIALHVDNLGQLQVSGTQYEDAAHTSGDAGQQMLAVRQDTAGTGIGANGDYVFIQTDSNGRVRTIADTSEVRPSNSTTTALDNDGPVVKASAGVLYGFQGYCDAAGFVQVHDKSSAPASSNVPVIVIPIASGAAFSLDLGIRGRAFSNGIAFGFSSTGPTYTDGGSHLWVDAQFI